LEEFGCNFEQIRHFGVSCCQPVGICVNRVYTVYTVLYTVYTGLYTEGTKIGSAGIVLPLIGGHKYPAK